MVGFGFLNAFHTIHFDMLADCSALQGITFCDGMRTGCMPSALSQLSALTYLLLTSPDSTAVGVLATLPSVADIGLRELRLQPPRLCQLSQMTQLTSVSLMSISTSGCIRICAWLGVASYTIWRINHKVGRVGVYYFSCHTTHVKYNCCWDVAPN